MTEEVKNEEPKIEVEAPLVKEQDRSVEEKARAQGWLPAEEAIEKGLDPDDAVSAQSYLDRGPVIKQLKMEKQRNRTVAKQLDYLVNELKEAKTQGYEQALAELQMRRNQAYDDLDTSTVRELDDEIERQQHEKDQYLQQVKQHQQQTADPEAIEFVQRNIDWWQREQDTMQYAYTTEAKIKLMHPNKDLEEIYNEVQKEVDAFRIAKGRKIPEQAPIKEAAPKKQKVSYVAPPQRTSESSGDGSYGFHDLTPGAKDTYMTMKHYYKDEFDREYTVDEFVKNQKECGYSSFDEVIKG